MKAKSWVSIFIAAFICAIVPAASPASYDTGYNAAGMEPLDRMTPNGQFTVFVQTQDGWSEAGSLTFDRFYRERAIDIGAYTSHAGKIRIRLVQRGGGAAHIDSVLLGGMPPLEVSGGQRVLQKISGSDFDVADVHKEGIEMQFRPEGRQRILTLTARVESTIISKVPFQFPLVNLYRPMTEQAVFYPYAINTRADTRRPFFREYSLSGSGHPSGYTYGWVSNDEKNLYVRIDFTPDNTMDGEKDYAKVYVKTGNGMKEFRVSVPETRWGKALFTYTDKAPYQHKVYEFSIPLQEIGIADSINADEIQLAFAAYGTASPPGGSFNPITGYYLLVYPIGSDVYGQLVNEYGNPVGAEFVISSAVNSQYDPAVAYNSTANQYLVVWRDSRSGDDDIWGRLVNADGTFPGSDFMINAVTTNSQRYPLVVYNGTANQYFVVWEDNRSGNDDIWGRLVNANGTFAGSDYMINAVTTNNQRRPSVAYNSTANQYLVAWEDNRSGTDNDIWGRLVNANETFPGTDFMINAVTTNAQTSPSVAYNSATNQYLIAWGDDRNPDNDIFARLVNANGTFPGTDIPVSTVTGNQYEPSVAYNPVSNQFMIVWFDYRDGSPPDIIGQLLDADGTLSGGDLLADDGGYSSTVVANTSSASYLIAFWDEDADEYAYIVLPQQIFSVPGMNGWGILVFCLFAGLGAIGFLRGMRKEA